MVQIIEKNKNLKASMDDRLNEILILNALAKNDNIDDYLNMLSQDLFKNFIISTYKNLKKHDKESFFKSTLSNLLNKISFSDLKKLYENKIIGEEIKKIKLVNRDLNVFNSLEKEISKTENIDQLLSKIKEESVEYIFKNLDDDIIRRLLTENLDKWKMKDKLNSDDIIKINKNKNLKKIYTNVDNIIKKEIFKLLDKAGNLLEIKKILEENVEKLKNISEYELKEKLKNVLKNKISNFDYNDIDKIFQNKILKDVLLDLNEFKTILKNELLKNKNIPSLSNEINENKYIKDKNYKNILKEILIDVLQTLIKNPFSIKDYKIVFNNDLLKEIFFKLLNKLSNKNIIIEMLKKEFGFMDNLSGIVDSYNKEPILNLMKIIKDLDDILSDDIITKKMNFEIGEISFGTLLKISNDEYIKKIKTYSFPKFYKAFSNLKISAIRKERNEIEDASNKLVGNDKHLYRLKNTMILKEKVFNWEEKNKLEGKIDTDLLMIKKDNKSKQELIELNKNYRKYLSNENKKELDKLIK